MNFVSCAFYTKHALFDVFIVLTYFLSTLWPRLVCLLIFFYPDQRCSLEKVDGSGEGGLWIRRFRWLMARSRWSLETAELLMAKREESVFVCLGQMIVEGRVQRGLALSAVTHGSRLCAHKGRRESRRHGISAEGTTALLIVVLLITLFLLLYSPAQLV